MWQYNMFHGFFTLFFFPSSPGWYIIEQVRLQNHQMEWISEYQDLDKRFPWNFLTQVKGALVCTSCVWNALSLGGFF